MDRRHFLVRLAGAAAAAVAATELDPDRLLWVPGQKTFFLPPAKTLITAEDAAVREILDAHQAPRIIEADMSRYILACNTPNGMRRYGFTAAWKPLGTPQQRAEALEVLHHGHYWGRRG